VNYTLRIGKQWYFRGANTFNFREEEKYLGLFERRGEDTMLLHEDGKYLAGDNGITT
jgi:hypothetical protein